MVNGKGANPREQVTRRVSPSGRVKVGDQTTRELEEIPYISWTSRGVEKGEFMDYPQWLTRLMVQYKIDIDIDKLFPDEE